MLIMIETTVYIIYCEKTSNSLMEIGGEELAESKF